MFDIGFWEMSLIGIVALLVIGPEKLPTVAKTVGSFIGKAQRYVQKVKTDISTEFDANDLMAMMEEQKKTIAELQSNMSQTASSFTKESAKIVSSIDKGDEPVEGEVAKAELEKSKILEAKKTKKQKKKTAKEKTE